MNWSTDLPSRRAFYTAVLVTVTAHAAVLWQAGRPQLALPHGKPGGVSMLVRMVQPAAEGRDELRLFAQKAAALAAAPDSWGGLAAVQESTAEASSKPTSQVSPSTQNEATPAASHGAPSAPVAPADPFLDYVPRSRLTVAPRPLSAVDVNFPSVEGLVDLRVQVTLFIDESGTVRKVRIDTPDVPADFARAISESFLPARFQPGEVETVAVRSQIRLEIDFRATR